MHRREKRAGHHQAWILGFRLLPSVPPFPLLMLFHCDSVPPSVRVFATKSLVSLCIFSFCILHGCRPVSWDLQSCAKYASDAVAVQYSG